MDVGSHQSPQSVTNATTDYRRAVFLVIRNMEQVWQYLDDSIFAQYYWDSSAVRHDERRSRAACAFSNPLTAKKGSSTDVASLTLPAVRRTIGKIRPYAKLLPTAKSRITELAVLIMMHFTNSFPRLFD